MVDKCDPAQLEQLLGEDWTVRVVSTSKTLRGSIQSFGITGGVNEFVSDSPISMARVLAAGFEPIHWVDGWPVSMSRAVGRGAIFVTTLGSRAWMDAKKVPTKAMLEDFGSPFLRSSRKLTVNREMLEPLVTGQIGRRIVSRRTVSLLLGLQVLGLQGQARNAGRKRAPCLP